MREIQEKSILILSGSLYKAKGPHSSPECRSMEWWRRGEGERRRERARGSRSWEVGGGTGYCYTWLLSLHERSQPPPPSHQDRLIIMIQPAATITEYKRFLKTFVNSIPWCGENVRACRSQGCYSAPTKEGTEWKFLDKLFDDNQQPALPAQASGKKILLSF